MKKFLLIAYALLAVVISLLLTAPAKPAYSFFQSPVETQSDSPVATPAPEEPAEEPTPAPPAEATPTPEANATSAPTQPPPPTEAPPEQQPDATATPIEVPPAAAQPTPAPPLAPTLAPVDPDAPMVVNEVKLIDTAVQALAWLWLCVGVSVILLALIFFPFLQIRGSLLKRKNRNGE